MPLKSIIRLSATPDGFGQTADELTSDMFVSKLPVQHSYDYYEDDDLGLFIGVWDTTDMIETAGPYACDEFMWLLEGSLTLLDEDGDLHVFKAGDAFFIPQGTVCSARASETVKLLFAVVKTA